VHIARVPQGAGVRGEDGGGEGHHLVGGVKEGAHNTLVDSDDGWGGYYPAQPRTQV